MHVLFSTLIVVTVEMIELSSVRFSFALCPHDMGDSLLDCVGTQLSELLPTYCASRVFTGDCPTYLSILRKFGINLMMPATSMRLYF